MEEEDLVKEIMTLQKNKKSGGVTEKDLNDMVVEDVNEKVIKEKIQKREEKKENLNKPHKDFKKELSLLISKSDIVIEVLDARDPFSYRSKELENNVLHNKDKKFVLILNKIDLVSKKNYETWASIFRKDLPTVLFSSKSEIFENSFKELTNLLKNLAGDKKATVCFVGYPNTGKNTIIQKIKEKKQSRKSQNLDTDEIILENNIFLYEKNRSCVFEE